MCISWWIQKLFSKFYSSWPRNRNIHCCSIISDVPRKYQLCHVDMLGERMKAQVQQFPLLHAVAVQSDTVHHCAGKTKSIDAQLIATETHPHREDQKKGLTLCFYNIWNYHPLNTNETRATWYNNLLYQMPWKMLINALCESRRNLEPQESILPTCDSCNFVRHFRSKWEAFSLRITWGSFSVTRYT